MTIPALPDAPALGDSPEQFNAKAFAFVAALDDWGTAANAVGADADADAASAAASASTATTQAGIATTKANEAAASALDANSAELGAQAAQTAAELAATNAAASYDSFDDRYLGAKSSDPTVDNDGGTLIIGALYFNTTDQKMKVYATLGWKDAGSAVNGTSRRQTFTATAGQTSFTVTDGYDPNFADVYLNGSKLVNGVDVTVSSGTAVVLTLGAAAGDVLDVIAYGAFEVSNTYTQAAADALLATKVSLTGDQTVAGVKTFSSQPVFSAGIALASGQGINFGANSNAAGMTSETLSDYEEGTWTPTIVGTSTAGTATYSTQVGKYTKIGNLVTILVYLTWTGHTGTGNMRVAGAPFTTDVGNQEWITFIDSSGLAVPANSIPAAYFPGNASQIVIASQNTTGSPGLGSLAMDAAATIVLNLTYQAA